MAFQIKNFVSIAAGAINWMTGVQTAVTDFAVGSVVRTMIEAVAAEIDELYVRMLIGLKEAIPVSVYNSFGFSQLPAEAAGGMVTFSAPSNVATNLLIPAGTTVQAPGGTMLYSTQANAYILAGTSSIAAFVAAQVAGAAGNTPAGTLTVITTPVPGVATATNTGSFINGADLETDAQRKTRFQAYIATLARGTNAALVYGAKTATVVNSAGVIIEHVATAVTSEPWETNSAQPVGLVNVYIHNGAGGTSSNLVAASQQIINGYYDANGNAVPGWKAAGVMAVVIAATDTPVNVTGTVTVASGYDPVATPAAVISAMSSYILLLNVGAPVIVADLIAIAMRDVPGVLNIVLSAPTADVAMAVNQKATPGTFTLP